MAKSISKIVYGTKGEKTLKVEGHIYPENIIKAQLAGYDGLEAESMDYRDFLKFKNRGSEFYLSLEMFGHED